MNNINSKDFDKNFEELLKTKESKKILKKRFDLESIIKIDKKIDFILDFILSDRLVKSLTYKILFWEEDKIIKNFIELNLSNNNYITKSYKNGQNPGVIFIDKENLDDTFFRILLINHFNYELALTPSLNMRVQLCVNYKDETCLLDIFDDRGFDAYYIEKNKIE